MSKPNKAVFLSYASQDVEAAQRICEALRAGGIEVWFDQSELRGGDAWDTAIRKQIKSCGLFIPVISQNTHRRGEGYFRLEWKLAVDRSHLISADLPFLLPVAIDDTRDDDERTPERFRELQWTRLPRGETPPTFVERVARLLSPESNESNGPSPAPAPLRSTSRPHTATAAPGKGWRPVPLLIAALALLGLGYFALDKFALSKHVSDAVQTPAVTSSATPTSAAISERSIAVLPFVDMSEKKDQEYFSDGLTEELLDQLAQVPDLRVPARTSSFYFKGKQTTIAEIARALGVANVLEGSVRKAGKTIRVTAQLIRADNGYHLWSKAYDRDIKDIFKVQDEIAGAVVTALKAKLLPSRHEITAHRTSSTEAYNEYLLGRQLFNLGGLENYSRAVAVFQKATALDPHYAAAYAWLSSAKMNATLEGSGVSDYHGALADADRAIELAPGLADGYSIRGALRIFNMFDWSGAQSDLEKALALDAHGSSQQRRYGALMATLGRLPEAIAAVRKAIEVDPLDTIAWADLGRYLAATEQYAQARQALGRSLEISPESSYARRWLGETELREGRAAEALAEFRQVPQEPARLCGVAAAEYLLGHGKESQQALDVLLAKYGGTWSTSIAAVFAWRGENDTAFEWLARAYQRRDDALPRIKYDPALTKLRADPRYRALLHKMNLPG